ncbi:inorganic phosphate transporter [Salinibacter ruber]|uniref:Phosphate transporter n=1 Tax=Salinibacter ruber TaxID=146919 RepID=A0A9X3A8X1_9BACT|nr:inorganic phosphate transporter [Salinibacter ruber]MCS3703394.1 PiT family inorganic phosphate transporter [Salinibacter ruber]MCS3860385.1 PiT family inorganic phosphate transporter [Salinibacter ruber]MCS4121271.1 PiT family inorganic phosphate transporter [Salinibacter ruber]MCS4175502.1 PiT family inorganic phosphate transporter [Salinibacter ruber]
MGDPFLIGGVIIACFVAFNIGGATTGPAFGPAVGANVLSKTTAGALMAVAFFGGAYTIGRRVVDTLGTELVHDPSVFTLEASIIVLFFIGGALLVGNLSGAPASTSMTAVGAIIGLGLASGELNFAVVGEILAWWILSPIIGFWLAVMVGRYGYEALDRRVAIEQSDGPLLAFERVELGRWPVVRLRESPVVRMERISPKLWPALGPNTSWREAVGTAVLVSIGFLMAFSSGTSNIANAIAPLVGSGALAMNPGILIGCGAVAVGALTIARRTMETLGNDITDLPLTAAIVVALLSSLIIIALSALGIPASFVVVATLCIIGLGWGRSTQAVSVAEAVRGDVSPQVSVGALARGDDATVGTVRSQPAPQGASRRTAPVRSDLFDPGTSVRVVLMQNVVPLLATGGSYLTFWLLPVGG